MMLLVFFVELFEHIKKYIPIPWSRNEKPSHLSGMSFFLNNSKSMGSYDKDTWYEDQWGPNSINDQINRTMRPIRRPVLLIQVYEEGVRRGLSVAF